MARGWESKSVESQIDEAGQKKPTSRTRIITPAELDRIRQKESLALSRTRVLHDIESARNPRYRELMQRTLAELDAQLANLGG
jgi:hypothetical protein